MIAGQAAIPPAVEHGYKTALFPSSWSLFNSYFLNMAFTGTGYRKKDMKRNHFLVLTE